MSETSSGMGRSTNLKRRAPVLGLLEVVLALCLLLSGLLAAACSREGGDPERPAARAPEAPTGGYAMVSTEELRGWLDAIDPRWLSDRDSLLLVDTTPDAGSYRRHHIPYAAHFEFPVQAMSQLDDKTRGHLEKILGPDRNRKVVFYCESAESGRALKGAMWAVSLGYSHVYVYREGIQGWMQAGNKTETAR